MSDDLRQPVDMREVIARLVDGSDFLEFKPLYGAATVCAQGAIDGHAVGFITNNGPIDVAGANKATHFIQRCCQLGHPIIYLQNTTGYMVGVESEQGGMIKHGSQDDPGGDQRHRAADHHPVRRVVWRGQLRHVRSRLAAALFVQLAERQNRRHGRRAGG